MKKLFLALCLMLLAGCGSSGGADDPIIDEQQTLSDGSQLSYALQPGTYHLDATASTNGLSVKWVGGSSCLNASEVLTYKNTCTLIMAGQMIISNPTTWGLGPSEIVTIKVWE